MLSEIEIKERILPNVLKRPNEGPKEPKGNTQVHHNQDSNFEFRSSC